jgi:spore germination protein YaaH
MVTALLAAVVLHAPAIKMSAWLVFDGGASMASFRQHAPLIDTVSAEWIRCDEDGNAVRRAHPTQLEKAELLAVARANHVRVLALASNAGPDGFSAKAVEMMMERDGSMGAHAAGLVDIAVKDGLDGIDLDYELLKGEDRAHFSRFVATLARACHEKHLLLAIALHPKDSEPGTWDGTQAQDYAAIGRSVDYARVMTYDEHWNTSEAGPVSSPGWAERVAAFAATEIPPSKLDIGIPGYGYDWVGKKGVDVSWSQFLKLSHTYGQPHRDKSSSELTLDYKQQVLHSSTLDMFPEHTVFFPDASSAAIKFKLARKLGVHGVALWRLGTEDPAMWKAFSTD